MESVTHSHQDRRSKRTQDLVFEAFSGLVQTQRYETFGVSDIITRAGIGRSTFYDHYANKDDVLLKSMEGPLSILVQSVCEGNDPGRLRALLSHFWERRAVARTILAAPMLGLIGQRLAEMIVRFDARLDHVRGGKALALAKAQSTLVAFGLFAVIETWLSGRISMKIADLADWILQSGEGYRSLLLPDQA
jgi:AcrR family transcriptional regulator